MKKFGKKTRITIIFLIFFMFVLSIALQFKDSNLMSDSYSEALNQCPDYAIKLYTAVYWRFSLYNAIMLSAAIYIIISPTFEMLFILFLVIWASSYFFISLYHTHYITDITKLNSIQNLI